MRWHKATQYGRFKDRFAKRTVGRTLQVDGRLARRALQDSPVSERPSQFAARSELLAMHPDLVIPVLDVDLDLAQCVYEFL